MKIKKVLYVWLWLQCPLLITLQAQEVVTTSGGYGETTGARITWTVGETVTETIAGTASILTQGFNQGDLIITIIKDPELPGFNVKAYPNPASDILKISTGSNDLKNLEYRLYNIRGHVVKKDLLTGPESEIPVGNLATGTYLLKIFQNNTELSIIKIIKHK